MNTPSGRSHAGASRRTLAVLAAALRLAARHPIAPLATEVREQPAAVQNCATLTVKALARPRPNHLRPMHSVLQAEHCAVAGTVDRRLDGGAGLDRDRIQADTERR